MLAASAVSLLLTEIVPTVRLGRRRCHETSLTCSPKRRSTRDALLGRLSGPAMLVHPRGDQVREGVCRGDEGDRIVVSLFMRSWYLRDTKNTLDGEEGFLG